MSSDKIIDARECFLKDRPVGETPSGDKGERAEELTRARWHAADQASEKLRKTTRIPEEDRPRLARNLGRLIEKQFPIETHARIRDIFHAAFKAVGKSGKSSEIALKKRKRYLRLADEPLPEATRPGEYHAGGAAFVDLAYAFAEITRRNSASIEGERRRVILNLIDGTSFDDRDSVAMRQWADGRNEFAKRMDELLEHLERAVDLDRYFDTTCSLRLNVDLDSDDPIGWKNLRIAPFEWGGRIGYGPDAEEREPWQQTHFLAPFVVLGRCSISRRITNYIPLRLTREAFEHVERKAEGRGWREAERALQDAILCDVEGQYGKRYRRMLEELAERAGNFTDELSERWDEISVQVEQGAEPLIWDSYPVHLGLVRERSTARSKLALVMPRLGLQRPEGGGWEVFGTHPIFRHTEHVLSIFDDCGIAFCCLPNDSEPVAAESAVLFAGFADDNMWLRDDAPIGEVMLLPGESGMRFAFTELNRDDDGWWFTPFIEDYAKEYSPVPSDTLAGVIIRNLAYAPAGKRINDLLIANAREKAKRVDAFLQKARNDYEAGIERLKFE